MEQHYIDKNKIGRSLLSIAVPTMAGYALQSLYDVVDMIWVGRISSEAVAGVTIFSILLWIGTVLNEMMNVGSISILSQSYAKGNREKTARLVEQSIGGNILCSILAGLIIFLLVKTQLSGFSQDPQVQEAAFSYGMTRILFIPFLFASYSLNTALRSVGYPRAPMVLMGISAGFNIVFDPLFIFDTIPWTSLPGLGLGVKGAAIATVLSTMISCIIGLAILMRKNAKVRISFLGIFKIKWNEFKHFIRVGIPGGAENLFRNLLSLLLVRFIAIYGTHAITAAGIGTRLFGFAYVPITGAYVAGSTAVANLLGQEDIIDTKKAVRMAILIGVVGIGILSIIAWFFPGHLMGLFIDDQAVIPYGIPMIHTLIPAILLGAVSMGLASAFIGSGYNKPFLIASIIARWFVQLPMLFITTTVLELSIQFVWWSFIVAGIVESLILSVAYKREHWLYHRV